MSEQINISTQKLKNAAQTSILTTSKEKQNILSNALVNIENGTITIASKNSTTSSIQTVKTESSNTSESFVININSLFNILKELKEETTLIEIDDKLITIKNGNFKTTLKTLNKELYPIDTPSEKKFIGNIDFNKIKYLMKATFSYPDKNDISREYTGVLVEIKNNLIKATATDHFRLINVSTKSITENINEQFIIENNGAALITKTEMEDTVKLYKNEQKIELKDSNKSIESKIINGDFPNYESILLNKDDNFILLETDEFLNSIKRVSITNINDEIEINITPAEKTVNIFSKNSEGEESTDLIKIKESNNNEGLKIKLNSKFIINFLSQINSEDVYLFYRSAEEPIMFKSEDDEYLYNHIMTPIID